MVMITMAMTLKVTIDMVLILKDMIAMATT